LFFFCLFVFYFFICAVAFSPSLSLSVYLAHTDGRRKNSRFSDLCVFFLCKANETKTKKSPKNLKSFCFDFSFWAMLLLVFFMYFCCNFQLFAFYICLYYFLIRFRWCFFIFISYFLLFFILLLFLFRLWWKWCQNGVLVTKAVGEKKEKGGNG